MKPINKRINLALKFSLLVFWAAFIWNFIEPLHARILTIGIMMSVIHLVEFGFKRSHLLEAGEPHGRAFFLTMLFGLVYWRPVLKQANSATPS